MRRFCDGDHAAFVALVERYQHLVYGTCRRVLADHGRAEDATQEVFIQFAADAGRIQRSLPAWLHRVARGKAIDMIRHEQAEARVRDDLAWAAPLADAAERDALPLLDGALDELDEEVRSILVEHFLIGHTQQQLAQREGQSQPTISRRIADAVEQLRAVLGRKGIALSVAMVASLLGDAADAAVPPGLAASWSAAATAAGAGKAAATGIAHGVFALVGVVVFILAGLMALQWSASASSVGRTPAVAPAQEIAETSPAPVTATRPDELFGPLLCAPAVSSAARTAGFAPKEFNYLIINVEGVGRQDGLGLPQQIRLATQRLASADAVGFARSMDSLRRMLDLVHGRVSREDPQPACEIKVDRMVAFGVVQDVRGIVADSLEPGSFERAASAPGAHPFPIQFITARTPGGYDSQGDPLETVFRCDVADRMVSTELLRLTILPDAATRRGFAALLAARQDAAAELVIPGADHPIRLPTELLSADAAVARSALEQLHRDVAEAMRRSPTGAPATEIDCAAYLPWGFAITVMDAISAYESALHPDAPRPCLMIDPAGVKPTVDGYAKDLEQR